MLILNSNKLNNNLGKKNLIKNDNLMKLINVLKVKSAKTGESTPIVIPTKILKCKWSNPSLNMWSSDKFNH